MRKFKRKIRLLINVIERVSVYSAPFLLCIIAVIHALVYFGGYRGLFLYESGEMSGHSIIVIYIIKILTKSMCKWYKRSLNVLILYHVFNMIYYYVFFEHGSEYAKPILLIYFTLVFSTISILFWFVSDSCKKAIALVNKVGKRLQR